MRKNKRILITVPATTARGGITNYYSVLRKEFPDDIEYFTRGSRTWPYRKSSLYEVSRAFRDFRAYKKRLHQNDVELVQTTTSLGINTTIRDGFFIRHAIKHGLKAIVFFRGWDDSAVQEVEKMYLFLFRYFFFGADKMITLSEKAKRDLQKWGYDKDIFLETTVVDKDLILHIDEDLIRRKFDRTDSFYRLLFLSRIERRKGIYELLIAYKYLQNDIELSQNIILEICGDGLELSKVKSYLESDPIKNIELNGFVAGNAKKDAFSNAHIFIFPSHGEGMPTAVLEAMAFGLPVLTTPVGGIVDFFVPGRNGYFISRNHVDDIVEKVRMLLQDRDGMRRMAIQNHQQAKEMFSSEKVAKRMESIFEKAIGN